MNLVAKEGIDATGRRTYAMRNSYDSAAEAEVDRQHQKDLLAAINGWDRALRRDECGAWRINGTRGSIHTWGDGSSWVLYVAGRSALHWTWLKKKLSFCRVTQDGDEGCLRIASLPTPEQAAVIRDALGIRKRMEFAPDDLERCRASMTRLALTARRAPNEAATPK